MSQTIKFSNLEHGSIMHNWFLKKEELHFPRKKRKSFERKKYRFLILNMSMDQPFLLDFSLICSHCRGACFFSSIIRPKISLSSVLEKMVGGGFLQPARSLSLHSVVDIKCHITTTTTPRLIYTGWSTSENEVFCGSALSKQVNTPCFCMA